MAFTDPIDHNLRTLDELSLIQTVMKVSETLFIPRGAKWIQFIDGKATDPDVRAKKGESVCRIYIREPNPNSDETISTTRRFVLKGYAGMRDPDTKDANLIKQMHISNDSEIFNEEEKSLIRVMSESTGYHQSRTSAILYEMNEVGDLVPGPLLGIEVDFNEDAPNTDVRVTLEKAKLALGQRVSFIIPSPSEAP